MRAIWFYVAGGIWLRSVFDGTFLPGRAWIAEPTPGTDSIFQSPERSKLCAAIESETLTCEGGQGREGTHDFVHDRSRMSTVVFDQHRIAAFALDKRRHVGLAKRTLEYDEVTLPVPKGFIYFNNALSRGVAKSRNVLSFSGMRPSDRWTRCTGDASRSKSSSSGTSKPASTARFA